MKKIIIMAVLVISMMSASNAQQTTAATLPTFEQFFKNKSNNFQGVFPIYEVDDKYYLEIGQEQLDKDILIIGDLKNGTSTFAKSTGIIRFSKGQKNNLNVSRNAYSERSVDNVAMSQVVSKSNMEPVSFVLKIEASGKGKGSYIIDITKQLIEGGDLFSFKNYSSISNPDPSRSNVETVEPIENGVVFNVIRSQNNSGMDYNGKPGDVPMTFQLDLVMQQLSPNLMPVKLSDKRVGFATQSYIDFGATGYGAKKVAIIKKWDIAVKATDEKKYKKGMLVDPEKPIQVYIDQTVPKLYLDAVKDGILAWNKCFETAGFKNVLQIIPTRAKGENWIASGKIMVSWGGSATKASTAIVDDPRTGEIKAAKIILSENLAGSDLLAKYFVACGANDERVQQDLYHPEVRKEIMKFKVAQGMAEVLGMLPNLAGSTAYTPEEISNPDWVLQHGFTSSITDNLEFNFVMNPGKAKNQKLFIPGIGAYDHFAINWAYRQFQTSSASFLHNGTIEREHFYAPEEKDNLLTQSNDLSSDLIKTAEIGIAKLPVFYSKLEGIARKMKDDSWDTYMLIASNFITTYDQYVTSVLPNIAGKENRIVMKNYNAVPVVYISKATQQRTFDFLNKYILESVPEWTNNPLAQSIDGSNTERLMLKTATKVVNDLSNAETIQALIDAEYSGRKDVFGTQDLFKSISHYIFKDFNPAMPTSRYSRSIQAKMVKNFIDLSNKNKLAFGLNELNIVVNGYMKFLIEQIDKLGQTHKDEVSKEFYELLKIQIDNEYLTK
jgi:Met-zincin/Domain of unknown function (DUF5117)/Domain of unknown function (DUF5118)